MFDDQLKNKISDIKAAIDDKQQKLHNAAKEQFDCFEAYIERMKPFFDTLFANRDNLLNIGKSTISLSFCAVHISDSTVSFSTYAAAKTDWLRVELQNDKINYVVQQDMLLRKYSSTPFSSDYDYTVHSYDELINTAQSDNWVEFVTDELENLNRTLSSYGDKIDNFGDYILDLL